MVTKFSVLKIPRLCKASSHFSYSHSESMSWYFLLSWKGNISESKLEGPDFLRDYVFCLPITLLRAKNPVQGAFLAITITYLFHICFISFTLWKLISSETQPLAQLRPLPLTANVYIPDTGSKELCRPLRERVKVAQMCLTLCNPMVYTIHRILQNTGVGSLSLLQGIFPTQGYNPGLLHCRWILYQRSPLGDYFLHLK